ncbi:uncharacterized protein LOC144177779 [Haemaphysalis longicornis]
MRFVLSCFTVVTLLMVVAVALFLLTRVDRDVVAAGVGTTLRSTEVPTEAEISTPDVPSSTMEEYFDPGPTPPLKLRAPHKMAPGSHSRGHSELTEGTNVTRPA